MVVEKCFKGIASSDAGNKYKKYLCQCLDTKFLLRKNGVRIISFISMGATLNPIIHLGYDSIVLLISLGFCKNLVADCLACEKGYIIIYSPNI